MWLPEGLENTPLQFVLRTNVLRHHFYLPEVNIQVQNGHEVISRLVVCLKCMEVACQVLQSHFEPVHLLQVSKNDDEEFVFSIYVHHSVNYFVYFSF